MPVVSRVPGVIAPPDAKPDIVYTMTEIWFKHGTRWSMSHMSWLARKE
jgi:hypothetical protein